MEASTLDLVERHGVLRQGFAAQEADPLAWSRFAVPRLRDALRMFVDAGDDPPIDELLARGPNLSGKTWSLCRYVVACMRKLREIDGIPLPQWPGRVEALCCVLDYKTELLSVQPAYLKAVGKWPHDAKYHGEYLSTLRVMPDGGDPNDSSDWSVLHFLTQENRRTGTGARADIVHFDEPPTMEILRELRKAGHIGRRSIRLIGMTPTKRREWAPIRDDYGDTRRNALRRVTRSKAEVRWSLHEVEPWLINADMRSQIIDRYAGDPLFGEDGGARIYGDYTNSEWSSPFKLNGGLETLMKMRDTWGRDPKYRTIHVSVEAPDGEPRRVETFSVEYWQPPRRGITCYQNIDPASGKDDNNHNPLALQLGDDDTGDLFVRWNGYCAPHALGGLAATLHRHYNGAWTDIEMMDHWGVNVLTGYQDAGGSNLCKERRELRPGIWSPEVGFEVRSETRAIWTGLIQAWIAAFKAGEPYAVCPSRAVFDCLLDMETDDRDRPVAGPGIAHGEDFVLLGQRLRRLQRPSMAVPKLHTPEPELEVQHMRKVMKLERKPRGASLVGAAGERPPW